MAVTLRRDAVAEILRHVFSGEDHRDFVVDMIDATFVSYVLEFFEEVVHAKMRSQAITMDWYREHFLDTRLSKEQFAWNSGINVKTIDNKRGTTKRQIVITESLTHFNKFVQLIESLQDDQLNVDLSLTLGGVTVHLDLNESLIVINALAVWRAALRGGAWSSMGKRVEGPLMETLCRVFDVEPQCFTRALAEDNSLREIDYFLLPPDRTRAKCEVKMMGKGNPEGADTIYARDTDVFVASTLSETNKLQLNEAGVHWTELQTEGGYLRFQQTLSALGIPHTPLARGGDHSARIESAITAALNL